MHTTGEKAPEYDPHGYSRSFQTFADDVNGDGWTDMIVVEFPGRRDVVARESQEGRTPVDASTCSRR